MDFSRQRQWGPKPNYPNVLNYIRPNDNFVVIAGPCSVESPEQINEIAEFVSKNHATHLRGGVFRAGTYAKSGTHFGWIDERIIESYAQAAAQHKLKNIIEVLDYTDDSLEMVNKYCDVFQVGARAQQNYSLLRKLGKYDKPVFLKRNTGCTVDEWLGSAEHLLLGGVTELHLIERGSSTFHNDVRWAPMIHTIPSVKSICNIPVIIDASHSTGRRDLVEPIILAGVAAGADGVLIETHPDPMNSLSDPEQAIYLEDYALLIEKVFKIREVIY